MASRKERWALVSRHLRTENLLKHLLATEACMKALAGKLEENEDLWAAAGLLHDIDLDEVQGDPIRHGKAGADILRSEGYPEEIINAVLAHAGHREATTRMEKALCAVDPTTGFIVAAALVRPDRKIDGLDNQSIRKRMKEKRFAANVDRETMLSIQEIGVDFSEYLGICLEAMKAISSDLGL